MFLLGETKTGKSTAARYLAGQLQLKAVSAGAWLRARTDSEGLDLEALTCLGARLIKEDPDRAVRYLLSRNPGFHEGGHLVEGVRNPRDFILMFRPERDLVVRVWFETNPVTPSPFEVEGLRVCDTQIDWLVRHGVLNPSRVFKFRLDALRGQRDACGTRDTIPGPVDAFPCWNLDEFMMFAEGRVGSLLEARTGNPNLTLPHGGSVGLVHLDLSTSPGPIDIRVDTRVLYDDNPEVTGVCEGKVFGISLYPGEPPTFQVKITSTSGMFSFVPPHRVRGDLLGNPEDYPSYDLEDLVYHPCPSDPERSQATWTVYQTLAAEPCQVWLRRKQVWVQGTYMGTIDWYLGNDLLHLVLLENGQFAFQPSHKVVFGQTCELPDYLKLHKTTWWEGSDVTEENRTKVLPLPELGQP